MNSKVNHEAKGSELFAEVGFQDKQTFLRIYGRIPAKKLKEMVKAIELVLTNYPITK